MTHVHDSIDDDPPTGKGLFVEEDFDVDEDVELGFEPAVSATGADPAEVKAARSRKPAARPKRNSRRGLRRRLSAGAVLIGALVTMGGTYAAFASRRPGRNRHRGRRRCRAPALPDQLHHLPRRQPAGRQGSGTGPDRRR